ncbi:hypothetical protein GHT06_016950 [Daphnia sinensis]|uniref:Uncharacterized protein n=1 Tax=Daphnia sinensis TaxID=1820382 RepID=A0AAD5PTG4_9CRUS|nr:hypothetical protein GHT06_016950 [Daphnia sinensis]
MEASLEHIADDLIQHARIVSDGVGIAGDRLATTEREQPVAHMHGQEPEEDMELPQGAQLPAVFLGKLAHPTSDRGGPAVQVLQSLRDTLSSGSAPSEGIDSNGGGAPDFASGAFNLRLSLPLLNNVELPASDDGILEALRQQRDVYQNIRHSQAFLNERLASSPVAMAEFFRLLTNSIFIILVGLKPEGLARYTPELPSRKPGLFGLPLASFGVVEKQARETPHCHAIVWGGLPPSLLQSRAAHRPRGRHHASWPHLPPPASHPVRHHPPPATSPPTRETTSVPVQASEGVPRHGHHRRGLLRHPEDAGHFCWEAWRLATLLLLLLNRWPLS